MFCVVAVADLMIVRLDQGFQFAPQNDTVDRLRKLLLACSSANTSQSSPKMPMSAESAPFGFILFFIQTESASKTCTELSQSMRES
jgi:hypothetical protein